MGTVQKVFVAIDLSSGAKEALRQAHSRAQSAGAQLAVCHVVPSVLRNNALFPHLTGDRTMQIPSESENAAEIVSDYVMEVTGRTTSEFEIILDHGVPYVSILTHAERWGADLMVVGSHGISGRAGIFLGKVSRKVVRHAHCNVLVARTGAGARVVVAGTDFSDPAAAALKAAAEEARRISGALVLVHSLDYVRYRARRLGVPSTELSLPVSRKDLERIEAMAREKLEELLALHGVTGQIHVARGPADRALKRVAAELRADLLVVGHVGRTGFDRVLLGNVAEAVVGGASCSVLVVRHPPPM